MWQWKEVQTLSWTKPVGSIGMITIKNLIKNFGELTAVSIPDFCITDGELVGLVGNNGAGKTTLFRMILDLSEITEGQITISHNEGNHVETIVPSQSEKWKEFTGAYLDEGFLLDFLTPEEYFDFLAQVNGMEEWHETVEQRFYAFMNGEILGQKKYIRDFSAGNKQKIGIIGAMMSNPQLLILDEPFNFLDPSSQNHLKYIITEYNRASNATILISSHNLQHTIDISSRIALMEHGKIIRDLPNIGKAAEAELNEYFMV